MIRTVEPRDAEAITTIYNYYVLGTVATFEEGPLSSETMGGRIAAIARGFPYLVCERDGELVGYWDLVLGPARLGAGAARV